MPVHPARCAAGAEHQGAARTQVEPPAVGQIAHQAGAVGVVAEPAIAVSDQGIDRACALGARAEEIAQLNGLLLVRQGDIGADPAGTGETRHRSGEIAVRAFDCGVFEFDPALPPEPGWIRGDSEAAR